MDGNPLVFLEDIAEKLEDTSNFWEQYLDIESGKFVILYNEEIQDFAEAKDLNEDLKAKILTSNNFVRLPNQYEIYEYRIMEDFVESISDVNKRERLFSALSGRKPFRHFKNTLIYNDLDQKYFAFRFKALIEIARDWCDVNNIPYRNRNNQEEV